MNSPKQSLNNRSKYSQKRQKKAGSRKAKSTFLIVCEGGKTEPNYFNEFKESIKANTVDLEIRGVGRNTNSLIKYAVDLIETRQKQGCEFDQIWCVFDDDTCKKQDINQAFSLAKKNSIKIAYSRQRRQEYQIFLDKTTLLVYIPLNRNYSEEYNGCHLSPS